MPSDIQKLREETQAGVMDCKKALEDAGGDFEKAKKFIAERGLAKAGKRAGRETGAGLVHAYVHNGRVGVLLTLRAETDFVARSEEFCATAHDLAMHIAAMAPANNEELLEQPFVKDEKKLVKDILGELVAKVGENVEIGEYHRIQV